MPLSAGCVLPQRSLDSAADASGVRLVKHLVCMRLRGQPSTAQKVLEVIYLLEKRDSISGAVIVNGDGAYLKDY